VQIQNIKNGVFWDVMPCGSSQKTPLFIVTAVKTSNLKILNLLDIDPEVSCLIPGTARFSE
jgi:hypothetical protein